MDDSNRTTVGGNLEEAGAGFARAAAAAQRSIANALFGTRGRARPIAGRYHLGERLGAGAQGAVWKATDALLDREVAIKTAHVSGTSGLAKAQEWLRHEAKMLGRVSHPNVVGVFDVGIDAASVFGVDDDGAVIFVVMELVRGRTLAQWLHEKERTPAEIDAVFVAIASGLQAVHDAGLVHCDVKPGNIFVTEHGVAKLGDFGLAHAQRRLAEAADEQGASSDATTTVASTEATQTSGSRMTGPRGGTPAYMPPEQFRGARVDARADQYALAGTWFEAVFRTLPHGRGTHVALFEAKVAGPPSRPGPAMSSRAFRALARGLAPDPRQRHASVVELARAVTDRGPRFRVAFAGVAVVAVIGGMLFAPKPEVEGCTREDLDESQRSRFSLEVADGVVTYDQQLARRVAAMWNERDEASLDARRAVCAASDPDRRKLACLDRIDRIANDAIDVTTLQSRDAFQRTWSVVAALPGIEVCEDANAAPAIVDLDVAALDADIRHATAELTRAAGLLDEGRATDALAVVENIHVSPLVASAFANEVALLEASALEPLGRFDESRALYQSVWDRALVNEAAVDAARAASGLAHIVGYGEHDVDAGFEWIRHGQSQLARVGSVPALEAELHAVSAMLHKAKGESLLALAASEEALATLPNEPQFEASRMGIETNAAAVQATLGDPAAEERLRRVLAWHERRQGPPHPDLFRTVLALAMVEHKKENLDAAQALHERALALAEEMPNVDELEVASVYYAIAGLAITRGEIRAAWEALDHVDEIHTRIHGPEHPAFGNTAFMRLSMLVDAGQIEAADRLAGSVRDRLTVYAQAGAKASLDVTYLLSRLDRLAGRSAKGMAALESAIAEAERRESHLDDLAMWSVELAHEYGKAGKLETAVGWIDRAEKYYAEHGGAAVVEQLIAALRMAAANERAEIARRHAQ